MCAFSASILVSLFLRENKFSIHFYLCASTRMDEKNAQHQPSMKKPSVFSPLHKNAFWQSLRCPLLFDFSFMSLIQIRRKLIANDIRECWQISLPSYRYETHTHAHNRPHATVPHPHHNRLSFFAAVNWRLRSLRQIEKNDVDEGHGPSTGKRKDRNMWSVDRGRMGFAIFILSLGCCRWFDLTTWKITKTKRLYLLWQYIVADASHSPSRFMYRRS